MNNSPYYYLCKKKKSKRYYWYAYFPDESQPGKVSVKSVEALRRLLGVNDRTPITRKQEAAIITQRAVDSGLIQVDVKDPIFRDYVLDFWDFEKSDYIRRKNLKNPDSVAIGPDYARNLRGTFNKHARMTLGFLERRLYYFGARPSQGKTALLLNFIANCNEKCGLLSSESAKEELGIRLLARESKIDSQRLLVGMMRTDEIARLDDSAAVLYDHCGVYVYDEPNMSIDTAVSIARRMKREYDIKILFVDYLQCLSPSRDGAKREYREQVAYASKQMKHLARTLNIPVVVAAQLRRDAEGNRPVLRDFSDSTQIERDADVAVMIHNTEANESWLLIEKNRDGQTGDVPVVFTKPHVLFTDKL